MGNGCHLCKMRPCRARAPHRAVTTALASPANGKSLVPSSHYLMWLFWNATRCRSPARRCHAAPTADRKTEKWMYKRRRHALQHLAASPTLLTCAPKRRESAQPSPFAHGQPAHLNTYRELQQRRTKFTPPEMGQPPPSIFCNAFARQAP